MATPAPLPVASPALAALLACNTVVMEGGLASELERRGHVLGSKLWSAELLASDAGVAALTAAHAGFVAAGARLLKTASYQCSPQGVAHEGLGGDAEAAAMMARSVAAADAARRGAPHPVAIAGSLGPLGAAYGDGSEYRGDYGLPPPAASDGGSDATPVVPLTPSLARGRQDVASLTAFHRPRLEALLAAQPPPDLIAFETLPCVSEVDAAAGLLQTAATRRLPAWISLQCRDGGHLASGEPIAAAVAAVLKHQPQGVGGTPSGPVIALGVNCVHPSLVAPALAAIRAAGWAGRTVAYPNRGEAWDAVARGWVALPPSHDINGERAEPGTTPPDDELVLLARGWAAGDSAAPTAPGDGVWAVGGCCRVGPDLVGRLVAALADRSQPQNGHA
jgi:homocysteine S-methyltransferase